MRASLHLASARTPNTNQVVEVEVARLLGTDGGVPLDIPLKGGDMIIIPEAGGITVEGEVVKAGAQDLKKGMTLVSALAAVGGITYSANVNEIELIRKVNADKTLRLIVDLTKIASGEHADVLVRNGDIIRVPSHSGRRIGQDTFDSITKLINFGIGGSVPLQ
jgi:protein involved in polysaccharide export with SLBB domain